MLEMERKPTRDNDVTAIRPSIAYPEEQPHKPDTIETIVPRPIQLYTRVTDTRYRNYFGKYTGILRETLIFWDVVFPELHDFSFQLQNEIRTTRVIEELSLAWDYWMVGRDKKHAQLTLVVVGKDYEDRNIILREIDGREHFRGLLSEYGIGYLVLDSQPDFLPTRGGFTSGGRGQQSSTYGGESFSLGDSNNRRLVFLVPGQTNRLPPCRIVISSRRGGTRRVATLGGIFENENGNYGLLALGRHEEGRGHLTGNIRALGSTQGVFLDLAGEHEFTDTIASTKGILDPSKFIPGKPLGFVDYFHGTGDFHDLALVRLEDGSMMVNTVHIPNGFGDSFVLTKIGDPWPDSVVWVVTERLGVLVGQTLLSERGSVRGQAPSVGALKVIVAKKVLAPEDSGSWVIDASERSFLGMLEVVEESVTLLPARRILENLERENGPKLSLPPSKEFSHSSPEMPPSHPEYGDIGVSGRTVIFHEKSSRTRAQEHSPKISPWNRLINLCCATRPVVKASMATSDPDGDRTSGQKVGMVNGHNLFELQRTEEEAWHNLEPQIEDIIRRTPTKSESESTPTVLLHGFMVKNLTAPAIPTVAISSSSPSYATHLLKEIRRSGVLDRSGFKVMILKTPIQKPKERIGDRLETV